MNITVSTHTTAIEAHIIRGRLEAEGVPAFVAFEHHVWAKWSLSVALGGVRVQVPPSCVEKAGQVLDYINTGKYQVELEEEVAFSVPAYCPSCSSVTTEPIKWPWKLALLAIFLVTIPVPYSQHLMKCTACSHTWVESKQRAYPFYITVFSVLILWAILFVIFVLWNHWCKFHCEQPIWV